MEEEFLRQTIGAPKVLLFSLPRYFSINSGTSSLQQTLAIKKIRKNQEWESKECYTVYHFYPSKF